MTVKELIAALKKMPQTSQVAWRDHDQSENEINDVVRYVERADADAIEAEMDVKNVHVTLCG